MMLSIKAICKSEKNEEVTIIGFELQGYCLCMTKSGTIFHAKHEDLTIMDKEYMESCAKESIDFKMADFLEKASARLDRIQSEQLTSIILELQEYRSKIEQGTLIELPCKVGDTVYCVYLSKKLFDISEAEEEYFIKEDVVSGYYFDGKDVLVKMVMMPIMHDLRYILKGSFQTREEAEKLLKELQE